MKYFLTFIVLILSTNLHASIVIEEGHGSLSSGASYLGGNNLRETNRVGVGLLGAGNAGLLATQIELNFEAQDVAQVMFGGGRGFNSIGFYWKHLLSAGALTPYFNTGYTRWYSSHRSGSSSDYNQGVVSSFLSKNEKRNGRFGLDFLSGSLGAQYHELNGEFAGLSYFAELTLLANPESGRGALTVGLGSTYFF